MKNVTKINKGWRECSQKLMSLSPIFSIPILSSTELSTTTICKRGLLVPVYLCVKANAKIAENSCF